MVGGRDPGTSVSAAMLVGLAAVGGGLGAAGRYAVDEWVSARWRRDYPLGTLIVNVTGSLLLGVLVGLLVEDATGSAAESAAGSAGVMALLGTGIALRDGWIAYAPFDELKIQAGRMYVPFTRSFGTESMFTLLTLEMPFMQGGVRSGVLYPCNVGRDDGVTVWGNLAGGVVQYRAGVFDGQQGTPNAGRSPRTAARVSINPLDKEGSFFNKGNYLGTKKVLSIGAGFDRQADLQWTAEGPVADYSAWTVDAFFDHPVGPGAVTAEWAYTGIKNSPMLGDAKTWYLPTSCVSSAVRTR